MAKVSDLINDLETGDRTMEHLKAPSSVWNQNSTIIEELGRMQAGQILYPGHSSLQSYFGGQSLYSQGNIQQQIDMMNIGGI